LFFFIAGESDDDSEHSGDAGEDTAVTEGQEKEAGDEFVDEEHETQFCLETELPDGGGQRDAESTAEQHDGKGTATTAPKILFK